MKKKTILSLVLMSVLLVSTVTVSAGSWNYYQEGKVNSGIYLNIWLDRTEAPFGDYNNWRYNMYGKDYLDAIDDINAGFEYYASENAYEKDRKTNIWYCVDQRVIDGYGSRSYSCRKNTYRLTAYVICCEFDLRDVHVE